MSTVIYPDASIPIDTPVPGWLYGVCSLFDPATPNPEPGPPPRFPEAGGAVDTTTGVPMFHVGVLGNTRTPNFIRSRGAIRFLLASSLPLTETRVGLKLYRMAGVLETIPGGFNPNAPWVGRFPVVCDWVGPATALTYPPPEPSRVNTFNLPALWTSGEIMVPADPTQWLEVDVLQAYNQARAAGHASMVFRLRETTETFPASTTAATWHFVGAGGPAIPHLVVGPDTPTEVTPSILDLRLNPIEPQCVILVGNELGSLDEPRDFGPRWGGGQVRVVRRGNVVRIRASFKDTLIFPGRYRNPTTVSLTLKHVNPVTTVETTVLNGGLMSKDDVGHWVYIYRTQASDPLGYYLAEVLATFSGEAGD